METTIVYWGYIETMEKMMEKKTETTIYNGVGRCGMGFKDSGFRV